jgi:hypothetical protein
MIGAMNRVVALFALAGFLLAAAVHVAALAGVDVAARIPAVSMLHVGIFVVFVPFVFSIRKRFGNKVSLAALRGLVPGWVFVAGAAVFLYTLVNFALFMVETQGGSPAISQGKFILQSHGHLVREITQGEYTAFRANEVRGASGHWLMFYFLPFAYFMFATRASSAGAPPA